MPPPSSVLVPIPWNQSLKDIRGHDFLDDLNAINKPVSVEPFESIAFDLLRRTLRSAKRAGEQDRRCLARNTLFDDLSAKVEEIASFQHPLDLLSPRPSAFSLPQALRG